VTSRPGRACLIGLGAALAIMTAACGSSIAHPGAAGGPSPKMDHGFKRPSVETPLPSPVDFKEAGIQLDVPPRDASPTVSYQQAFETCFSGDSVCESDDSPAIYLALISLTSTGTLGKGGVLEPSVLNRLGYVIRYDDVSCLPMGGPPQKTSSRPRSMPKPRSCTELSVVDASTGKALYGVRGETGSL
jgi:hypothetical protein